MWLCLVVTGWLCGCVYLCPIRGVGLCGGDRCVVLRLILSLALSQSFWGRLGSLESPFGWCRPWGCAEGGTGRPRVCACGSVCLPGWHCCTVAPTGCSGRFCPRPVLVKGCGQAHTQVRDPVSPRYGGMEKTPEDRLGASNDP